MPTWEERQADEAQIRRRWDPAAVVAACGPEGQAMVAVVDAVSSLDRSQAEALDAAYWSTRAAAGSAGWPGLVEAWERAF
ncbi:MAG: hypothetical protein ACYCS2_08165, partial [Acidimicrobiales bacterium]